MVIALIVNYSQRITFEYDDWRFGFCYVVGSAGIPQENADA